MTDNDDSDPLSEETINLILTTGDEDPNREEKENLLVDINAFLQLSSFDAKFQICDLYAGIRRSEGNKALKAADALYHLSKLGVRSLVIR